MNENNNHIKLEKILYYLLLILLTAGASLILGLLSFSGMYALYPLLPLAFASFVLSVAYEGEIYLQNLKGAFNKLFKPNYLKNYLAKEYLLANFPVDCDITECPQFFKDYKAQLELLSVFEHKALNKESRQRKKQIQRTLKDMEKWFAIQLFAEDAKKPGYDLHLLGSVIISDGKIPYSKELALWFIDKGQKEVQEEFAARSMKFTLVKVFSLTAGFFMTLGTTYLIVEAFSVIPFFATIPFTVWPMMVLPMAVIAGSAYGMLTFNAVTDLVNNNTLVKWYYKLRNDLNAGATPRNILMTVTAIGLVAITLALTIFTAGTWWTVATNARPLFDWMKNMPTYIMGVINPIVIGFSAASFNLENMAESLDMVDEELNHKKNLFQRFYDYIRNAYLSIRTTENWLQIVNPFRLIRLLTITPLRIIFFLGHLVSIALTADRMPGVPQIVAALTALISEGFEDVHYFVDHDEEEHEHDQPHDHTRELLTNRLSPEAGHHHGADIPTWILKKLATPVYALAALWDAFASTLNKPEAAEQNQPKALTLRQAWYKQMGQKEEQEVVPVNTRRPSPKWQVEHAIFLIEKHQHEQLARVSVGQAIASDKIVELDILIREVRRAPSREELTELLEQAKQQPVYSQHRLFGQSGKTATKAFLDGLPNRLNMA